MQPFQTISSIIAPLPIANIDTDMIIPKQYLKTIKRTGLGKYLFAEMRYDEKNHPVADFILNQSAFQQAQILLAEENFGCGSSREHAVWSLIDFGIKVIIAPSFADIFYSNCFKNGLLPITLSRETIEQLLSTNSSLVTVNLELQIITVDDVIIEFSIDGYRRNALLNGLDEIGETLISENKIIEFELEQKKIQPWLYSGDENA